VKSAQHRFGERWSRIASARIAAQERLESALARPRQSITPSVCWPAKSALREIVFGRSFCRRHRERGRMYHVLAIFVAGA
jgi:hypothetical protein